MAEASWKYKMTKESWKYKMTERWKQRSPRTLKENVTLERLVIPRPITEVMKENLYYTINIEIKALPANQSNEEKKCRNSKLETYLT